MGSISVCTAHSHSKSTCSLVSFVSKKSLGPQQPPKHHKQLSERVLTARKRTKTEHKLVCHCSTGFCAVEVHGYVVPGPGLLLEQAVFYKTANASPAIYRKSRSGGSIRCSRDPQTASKRVDQVSSCLLVVIGGIWGPGGPQSSATSPWRRHLANLPSKSNTLRPRFALIRYAGPHQRDRIYSQARGSGSWRLWAPTGG